MIPFKLCFINLLTCLLLLLACSQPPADKTAGPLRVSDINPRYFTDNSGKAVYLTGSHTWNNLVDMTAGENGEVFDYGAFLHWMKSYNHNFMRLWAWELLNWDTNANQEEAAQVYRVAPHAWLRAGPGDALDGLPRFDLTKPNPDYFARLKDRVHSAADSGIYVAIMLFEGWGMQFSPNAFANHPFHPGNNINGINGDANGDGSGVEIHELVNAEITTIQKDYVKQVIDTVNEFDNVLYEISNENHPPSTPWQYEMITFIKAYEKTLPKQHPVGMTFQYRGGSNQTLFDSPADWISPNPEGGYTDNPPAGDGRKVIVTDTDHLWGIGGNQAWAWKSFLRGLNPLFMDPYDGKVLRGSLDPAWAEPLRKTLGYTRAFAQRMDLIHTLPLAELASSGYCLANKGKEYLVYLPQGPEVTVDITGFPGNYAVEWFDPNSGESQKAESVAGDQRVILTSPFSTGDAVVYLKVR